MSNRAKIRVGVAGWDYPDWKGVLYPHPRPRGFDPVQFLAGYMDLIEINSTFYRPPTKETARKWVDRVTDFPDFRLDALLLQFPWSFKNDEASNEWLADLIDTFKEYPLVVVTERHVGFVNVDQPQFKKSIKPSALLTSHVGYVRVHGRNYSEWFRKNAGRDARYDYLYSPEELEPWVERTKKLAKDKGTETVDVVFNNHFRGQAVVNAMQFQGMLEGVDLADVAA